MHQPRNCLDNPTTNDILPCQMTEPIPTFYLYGEPHRSVDRGFIHVESLDDRSRPSEWTIQPHSHAELNHMFLIGSGGGTMRVDGVDLRFTAPSVLVVPATRVHGFSWAHESRGWVATIAQSELDAIQRGDDEIATLFSQAHSIALDAAQMAHAENRMAMIARELTWSSVGRHAALRGAVLDLIALALRGSSIGHHPVVPNGPHAALTARFRERVEARFRLREPVAAPARALGVGEATLRTACARIAGQSPAMLIDQRAVLEARRILLYSSLPVAEVGYVLGFTDPAYFSRFFQRHVGQSPRAYRLAKPPS